MDRDTIDINDEYERIFGSTSKPMLFDEEEYVLLRKEIEEYALHHTRYVEIRKLPFEGIYIPAYPENLEKIIESYNGYRLFFVEKRQDNIVIARAAAYFNSLIAIFFVIRGSYCKETNYTIRLFEDELSDYSKYFDCENGYCVQRSTKGYKYPDLAAKLFIGEMASIKDWVDKDGYSLDSVYSYFRSQEVKDREKQDVSNETARTLSTIIRALMKHAQKQSKKDTYHLFYIKQDDCDAKGYFNPEDEHFYICEGSIVSFVGEIDDRRKKFLINFCRNFTTIKLTQCISASEAAYYVTGRKLSHTVWRDKNDRYLTNYYPKEQITRADRN